MKVIYKLLKTKTGSLMDVLYVPRRCVITHSHYLDNYLYSPKEDWLRKYWKAEGIVEKEIDVEESVIEWMMEVGEKHIDPRGKIHNIENEEFRLLFLSLLPEDSE